MFFRKRDPENIRARIGVWGATNSGKSSYLAALSIASLLDRGSGIEIYPDDRVRAESSARWHGLQSPFHERRLPPGTQVTEPIALTVNRRGQQSTVLLQDPRGGDFTDSEGMDHPFWRELSNTQGIIYLFDPVLDMRAFSSEGEDDVPSSGPAAWSATDEPPLFWLDADTFDAPVSGSNPTNFTFLYRGIDHLYQICKEEKRLRNGRLPHHLAVCLTKIDHNDVFLKLYNNGLLSPEATEDGAYTVAPLVLAENCAPAFKLFAPEILWNKLMSTFDPKRVSFFAVSACGYYSENRRLIVGDSSNVKADGVSLRREAKPVSVLDPFTWLVETCD